MILRLTVLTMTCGATLWTVCGTGRAPHRWLRLRLIKESILLCECWMSGVSSIITLQTRVRYVVNTTRSLEFRELHGRHTQAYAAITTINRMVQRVQLAISREVVRADSPQFVDVPPQEMELPAPDSWWKLPPLTVPAAAVRWYGDTIVRLLTSWLWQSVQTSPHPVVWISHFQLYVDFMASTGNPGPIHRSKWLNGADIPNLSLLGYGFKQRTRWFIKIVKETLRHQKVSLPYAYGKPKSHMILFHTGCIGPALGPRAYHLDWPVVAQTFQPDLSPAKQAARCSAICRQMPAFPWSLFIVGLVYAQDGRRLRTTPRAKERWRKVVVWNMICFFIIYGIILPID